MLRIEVDLFSGRPNPVWIVTDGAEAKQLLDEVAEADGSFANQESGSNALGFREVRVDVLGDDEPRTRNVPASFALGTSAATNSGASGEIAARIIKAMPVRSKIQLLEHAITPLNPKLRDHMLVRLAEALATRSTTKAPATVRLAANPLRTTVRDPKCERCEYEVSQYNPAFWNAAAVRPRNNCYNYARNWRTNTFAQPGRAHGAQAPTMSCSAVTAAAVADGLKKLCTCLPRGEYPRRLMALVIDPGYDYHWYRHQRGGFWGHKPGQTAARKVDNSNVVITNPETCNRGGYTDFCGYFYAGVSVVIN